MTWFYVKDGEAAGPISDAELLSQLRLGSVLPTTLVWRKGMFEWRMASLMVPEIPVAPTLAPSFSPALPTMVDAPPELTGGPPPVLPNFFCTYCGTIIPADQLVHIRGRAVCAACKPRYVQQVSEGLDAPLKAPVLGAFSPPVTGEVAGDLADPPVRLVGYILDLLFIIIPIMAGALAFGLVMTIVGASGGGAPGVGAAVGLMAAVFSAVGLAFGWMFFYWTFFIGRRGATPGMKIMKLKMVRSDGAPVSYGRALGRALLLYIINAFTMGLTNITAFFDREKRTVVDMMCDTRVVRN